MAEGREADGACSGVGLFGCRGRDNPVGRECACAGWIRQHRQVAYAVGEERLESPGRAPRGYGSSGGHEWQRRCVDPALGHTYLMSESAGPLRTRSRRAWHKRQPDPQLAQVWGSISSLSSRGRMALPCLAGDSSERLPRHVLTWWCQMR